ncbi:hypothetical protein HanIR_Chr07g0314221 [Helianthus annuus]|nr:hypothetical protein HanIR_Chr07g0314221 [Helianthus annuus]
MYQNTYYKFELGNLKDKVFNAQNQHMKTHFIISSNTLPTMINWSLLSNEL